MIKRSHSSLSWFNTLIIFTLLVAPVHDSRAESAVLDAQVNQLLDEDYDFQMRTYPIWASIRGDRRFDSELPEISPRSLLKRQREIEARLKRAEALVSAHLTEDARTNLELLVYELKQSLKKSSFKPEQIPITQLGGPHIELPQLSERLTFTRREHLEDYLSRLEKVPTFLEQTIDHMRSGVKAQHVPPKVVMAGVITQLEEITSEAYRSDPSAHPLFKPFKRLKDDDPIASKARKLISAALLPAFERLKVFIHDVYIPSCRDTISASQGGWGAVFYDFQLKSYTTLPLTAHEIHEIGLAEVKRIRAEMMQTITRSDFSGKRQLKGDPLFAAFIHDLRTHPRFYHKSAAEMLRHYAQISKLMDAELPKLFKRLPRLPYGIKAMPDYISKSAPTAYYYPGSITNGVAGYFMVNTSSLHQRPTYEMRALTYHEAVPGHHLQIALSQELEEAGMHKWRELVHYTAFIEGWGLYAERLGLSVGGSDPSSQYGFYEDPYDDFGRLSYEMWRALRLVVDTGIHAKGWTRQRAIDLMLSNSALTRKNIENEVDRYISWPGQATAYKIGELKIRELRQHAEDTLGKRFDIRAFHDVILRRGPLPLPTLERVVKAWVKRRAVQAQ